MNDLEKTVLKIALIGFLLGVLAADGIAFVFGSVDGDISFVAPELAAQYGEAAAIALQTILGGLMGVVTFTGTLVYHSERYSLLAATLIHMAIAMAAVLSVAYFLYWIRHTLESCLLFLFIMFIIYAVIWFSVYISYRIQIQQINESLERKRSGKQ